MRMRNLALAVATVWVSLLVVPDPTLAERIPTKPLEPLDGSPGGGGHDSDPWVPDGSLPTGAALSAPNVRSDDTDAPRVSGLTREQKINQVRVQWYLRILRIFRSVPGGAVR